jgi:hypothetical protein
MPQQEEAQNVPGVAQSPMSSTPSLAPNDSNPQTDYPYPWPSTSPPLDQPKPISSNADPPRPAHASSPRRRCRRSQSHLPNLNQHMEIDLIGLLFTDPSHVSFPTYHENPITTIPVTEHEPHPSISRPPRQEAARCSTPTSAPALTPGPSELEHAGMDHDTYLSTDAVPSSNENSKHDFNDPPHITQQAQYPPLSMPQPIHTAPPEGQAPSHESGPQ